MTKEELKSFGKEVLSSFLQSEDFTKIIRVAVETGFQEGCKSIALSENYMNILTDRERAVQSVFNALNSRVMEN